MGAPTEEKLTPCMQMADLHHAVVNSPPTCLLEYSGAQNFYLGVQVQDWLFYPVLFFPGRVRIVIFPYIFFMISWESIPGLAAPRNPTFAGDKKVEQLPTFGDSSSGRIQM